ncbi:major facilitator superfamily domain-containing protein [Umbelopsis sp. PMI_123]|nr:major facilitator superfamily domain-containing protein [Umbelopsis sp. PMI_123]
MVRERFGDKRARHDMVQCWKLSSIDGDEEKETSIHQSESKPDSDVATAVAVDPKQQRQSMLKRVLTFIGLQLTLFLAALDGTIVATAMPTIGSEFNQMHIVAWVATAYILTFDAFQPLFSKFSDIWGRKAILLFGTAVFLFGSVLSGAATTIIMLIVSRAISGIGAAAILSMVFVIISELVPLEQRGKYQGVVNAVFAISSVCGPLIGGGFADHATWRWSFYMNLPIGGIGAIIIIFFLHSPAPEGTTKEKLKRVDYLGTILVLLFTTLFLIAMNFGGQTFPWSSPAVIVPLVFTVIFIVALCWVESRYAKEPLMPPRLFKNQSVVAIMCTNFFFGCAFFAIGYYQPVYFQAVRGDSAVQSGIRLFPMQLIIPFMSTSIGWIISRYGQWKPFMQFGITTLCIGVGLLSLFDYTSSWSLIYGITSVCGIGIGSLFGAALIGIQASAEPRDIAVVTGLCSFARILGGALGVAISSAIINSSLTASLPQYMPSEIAANIIDSSLYIRNGLPSQYFQATIDCYVAALKLLWYVMAGFSGVGVIASLFIKHSSLRKDKVKNTAASESDQEQVPVEEKCGHDIASVQHVDTILEVHDETSTPKN